MRKKITYYSTNRSAGEVSFREALLKGLAPDGGLYMPSAIPQIGSDLLQSFKTKEYHEIASEVLNCFLEEEIESDILSELCRQAYNFAVPVEEIEAGRYILRLDRGPTASFKDFAARMMARLMNHFLEKTGERITILTATSGDTGSAVANAFSGLGQIDVIIFFPLNEVSPVQRKQMTTLKGNIRVVALDGKFDDCQAYVKKAFQDNDLLKLNLSSANSINIGRLLPQSVYYFYAWSRVREESTDKVIFSVPCGNFGNLMGGIIAREMGLPVHRFVIATNENDEVPEYFRSGCYTKISPSKNCISNAMNVGHPSNLSRIIAIYGGIMDEKGNILKEPDMEKMRKDFFAISIDDNSTKETVLDCFNSTGVILDPHGAVAWKGLQVFLDLYQESTGERVPSVTLETAHPAKFGMEFLPASPLPANLEKLNELEEEYTVAGNSYPDIKENLIQYKKR